MDSTGLLEVEIFNPKFRAKLNSYIGVVIWYFRFSVG